MKNDKNKKQIDPFVDEIFTENFRQKIEKNSQFCDQNLTPETDEEDKLDRLIDILDRQQIELINRLDALRKIETEDARIETVKLVNLLRSQSVDTRDYENPF